MAARYACFDQPDVTVFNFIEDLPPYLLSCSISINPDKSVRGSSLKVIESLAAGRVCVSTRDGAQGLASADLSFRRRHYSNIHGNEHRKNKHGFTGRY
jgi:hypothetical protein